MTKRLFIGVPLLKKLRDVFLQLQSLGHEGLRWTSEENLHLTLCFLGNVPEARIPGLVKHLRIFSQTLFPVTLTWKSQLNTVYQPQGGILWAELESSNEWDTLISDLRTVCEPYWENPPQYIHQIPHITLARLQKKYSAQDYQWIVPDDFVIDRLVLYQSDLKKSGTQYIPLQEFRCGHSNAG